MRRGLTPDRVAAAAVAIADADGLDAVTIARVAADLGVRPPSLYNHVASRDELLRAIARRALLDLEQAFGAAALGRSGPGAIRAVAHAWRTYANAHPGAYAATVRAPDDDAGDRLVAVVVAVLRGFELTDEDALHAVRILRSALHGFVALELAGGFGAPIDVDVSFERLVDVLIAGLEAA